jgi:hypothetical protein
VTGTDQVTNTGNLPASRLTQTVQAPSCAPVQFANWVTGSASDPMLPRYTTAFQQGDKWGTTSAATLSGSAYAADVVQTNAGTILGGNFTVGIWFKVASGYSSGGGLISLGSSPANTLGAAPPIAVWMDGSGKVRFRVVGTLGPLTGATTAAYNDGSWHFAALSQSATGAGLATLYVDGTSVTAAGLSLLTGVTGYWHAGWVDTTGIGTGAPSSPTLAGSLSGAFVRAATTDQTTVSSLRTAASATAYRTAVLGLSSVQQLWMLDDTGTTTFTGILPSSMTAPCGKVNVSFAFTNPTGSIAQQSLAGFANGTATTIAAPGPSTTQTMTVSVSRAGTYSSDIAGLRLYAPLTITEKTATGSWSLAFAWTTADGVFVA